MEEEDGFVCLLVCVGATWFSLIGSNGGFTLCVASVRNCSQQLIVLLL